MAQKRFLIAAFDEWEGLRNALAGLGTQRIGRGGALLHVREDEPSTLEASCLLEDMVELRFSGVRWRVRCTAGALAKALAKRSTSVRNLAEALGGRMSPAQAREVQWHVEKGRIVLWLVPSSSADADMVCARLAHASPHLVEVGNIDLEP